MTGGDVSPGSRGRRWSNNGADWLAIELGYGLGHSLVDLAERSGLRVSTIKSRLTREGWTREPDDGVIAELMKRVELASSGRRLLQADTMPPGARLRAAELMIRLAASPQPLKQDGKRERQMDGGRHDPEGDYDPVAELNARLDQVVDCIEREGERASGEEADDDPAGRAVLPE